MILENEKFIVEKSSLFLSMLPNKISKKLTPSIFRPKIFSEKYKVILLPGTGFRTQPWFIRVSLSNLYYKDYVICKSEQDIGERALKGLSLNLEIPSCPQIFLLLLKNFRMRTTD